MTDQQFQIRGHTELNGDTMKKLSSLPLVLAAAFVAALSFASCSFDANTDDPTTIPGALEDFPALVGTWNASSSSDKYVLTDSTLTYHDYSAGAPVAYTADIENLRFIDAEKTSGYLTVKITDVNEELTYEWDGVTYPSYTLDVGTFICVYWKNLDTAAGSVQMATPYKYGSNCDGLDTTAEAEAEYTGENEYFGMTGAYVRAND
ncbi:MAG: hypothetical protein JXP39_02090 [Spirochaetales bacterium]|nr:hypothetical protein [Spirochaetales bacterium]